MPRPLNETTGPVRAISGIGFQQRPLQTRRPINRGPPLAFLHRALCLTRASMFSCPNPLCGALVQSATEDKIPPQWRVNLQDNVQHVCQLRGPSPPPHPARCTLNTHEHLCEHAKRLLQPVLDELTVVCVVPMIFACVQPSVICTNL